MDFEEKIVLENDRVKLELLGIGHLKHLLPIAERHPDLLLYSPSPFGSEELLKLYIEKALADRENKNRYPFVIINKADGAYAGSTSYGNISIPNQRLEIGWTWLDKKFHGSGLNKSCKFLLLDYAFGKLGIERVELKTDSRNLQSRKAIEKIGGIFEGELRSHTLMRDGFRRNSVYYSILKEEWENLRHTTFGEFYRL